MVKIVEPSVLTMSGSSTPSSWTLVVENAGDVSFWPAVVSGVRPGIAGSASGGTAGSDAPCVSATWRCA
jgi:hypothetical protein